VEKKTRDDISTSTGGWVGSTSVVGTAVVGATVGATVGVQALTMMVKSSKAARTGKNLCEVECPFMKLLLKLNDSSGIATSKLGT
jgi:hypothetical protein